MRALFHIAFAFYFLALSVIPCGDKEDCNEFKCTELSQAADHHDHDDEVCTPFCVCACCATHFVAYPNQDQLVIAVEETQAYSDPLNSKVIGAIIPIWQPPKLAC